MTRSSPLSGDAAPGPGTNSGTNSGTNPGANLGGRIGVHLVIPRSLQPRVHRSRGVRGLRAQDHFLPLLVSATLLTTLALVFIAYLTIRADVLASQQEQVTRDVRIAQNMLVEPGMSLAVHDGKLVVVDGSGQAQSLEAASQVNSIRALTGERYALYQLKSAGLVAVTANGLGGMGDAAPTPAYNALIADCGPLAPSSCHHVYIGAITLADGTYTAAFSPLFDAKGVFVGALAVAQPQSAVLAPAAQFSIVLLFVGLLASIIVLAAGVWTYNALSGEVLDTLHLRLNHLATVARELERTAGAQIQAAHRQERMARQISEGARDIDALVNTMRQGHLSMHESASDVWAEMSQPGAAPDPTAAMRYARQAVVMAAHVGVTTEDARTRCNHVVRLMNQVIAEGHVLSGHGREAERRSAELREVIAHVERAIEEPLAPRTPAAYASVPLADRAAVSLGEADPADTSLVLRVTRVARVHVLRAAHTLITRLLATIERVAREVEARLPERARGQATSRDTEPAASAARSDATTRPSSGPRASGPSGQPGVRSAPDALRGTPSRASQSCPPSQPKSQPGLPPFGRPAQSPRASRPADGDARDDDAFDLPRLIDLTRHLDRSPQSGSLPRSQDSLPGSQANPSGEASDEDDENLWRLP